MHASYPLTAAKTTKDVFGSLRADAGDDLPQKPEQPWRPFPIEILPPVISQFAAEAARTLCVDPVMAALPMLTIGGACIGNTARARMSADYSAPPNIWTANMVRSGERKSPVLRAIMRPLHDRQAELAEQHAEVAAQYDADFERWKNLPKKERGDEPLSPPPFPHLFMQDCTTEAIALRLHEQPRGLAVVLDELAALFGGMNQYRAGGRGHDRETYLAFYDAGPAKIDRKTATPPTIYIPSAFVAITGMIQPGALAQALGPAEFFSGMAARFILASPPPIQARWTAEGIPDRIRDAWRDALYGLLAMPLPEKPILIPPSTEAMRLWSAAHDRMEADRHSEPDDRMRAARAKLIGVIPRIALVHEAMSTVLDGGTIRTISDRAMRSAIEIAEWCVYETRRCYGLLADGGDDQSDDGIIEMIDRDFDGVITVRELSRRRWRLRKPASAETFLDGLVHEGIGRWSWRTSGGRPSKRFTLLQRIAIATSAVPDSASGALVDDDATRGTK